MLHEPVERFLEQHGIRPSRQRCAIAQVVLRATDHPSADRVLAAVRRREPAVSRATVYNTLNLFVEKGLLVEHVLAPGHVVFDPNVEPHHHFVDDDTGEVHDIPWAAIDIHGIEKLPGLDVRAYGVVLRGRRARR